MELPGTPELGNAVPGCWIRMQHQMSKHRPSHSRFASGIASAQSPAARAAHALAEAGWGGARQSRHCSAQCPVSSASAAPSPKLNRSEVGAAGVLKTICRRPRGTLS